MDAVLTDWPVGDGVLVMAVVPDVRELVVPYLMRGMAAHQVCQPGGQSIASCSTEYVTFSC